MTDIVIKNQAGRSADDPAAEGHGRAGGIHIGDRSDSAGHDRCRLRSVRRTAYIPQSQCISGFSRIRASCSRTSSRSMVARSDRRQSRGPGRRQHDSAASEPGPGLGAGLMAAKQSVPLRRQHHHLRHPSHPSRKSGICLRCCSSRLRSSRSGRHLRRRPREVPPPVEEVPLAPDDHDVSSTRTR